MVRKAWLVIIASAAKKLKEMNTSAWPSPVYTVQDSSLTSNSPMVLSPTDMLRFVSSVILDSVRLTVWSLKRWVWEISSDLQG